MIIEDEKKVNFDLERDIQGMSETLNQLSNQVQSLTDKNSFYLNFNSKKKKNYIKNMFFNYFVFLISFLHNFNKHYLI